MEAVARKAFLKGIFKFKMSQKFNGSNNIFLINPYQNEMKAQIKRK